MHLSQTISMLLASILLVLSFADATPDVQRRSPSKFITLPTKRRQYERKDLHPRIVTGQIVNRGLLRLARMTGRQDPPRDLLERNIMRRVLAVEGLEGLEKRFNRRSLGDSVVLDKRFNPFLPTPSAPPGDILADVTPGEPIPVTKAKPPTANNSLGLDIVLGNGVIDITYVANIQIGTPSRNFSILVDSGSADFWVGSENCGSGRTGCGDHVYLGPNSSTSFVDTGVHWNIQYGSGSVAGTIVKDNVTIAGLALTGHTFGVATSESQDFFSADYDGIIGLGQSTLSLQKTPTPLGAFVAAGLISEPIVSYKLSRSRDNKDDGEITFGALDPNKFDNTTVTTFPSVSTRGFWEANITNVTVDGKSLGLPLKRTAVLDTGTTFIFTSTSDAAAIHDRIPGSLFDLSTSEYKIPCNTTTVVSLGFGGRSFDIDSRDLSAIPLDNNNFTTGYCISGIAGINLDSVPPNQWLVGDVFLKNVYFSTNSKNSTITLAKLA